ncbi:DNA-binding response regulator, partial [Paraburkholderia sp. Se-20369]|nr:DNA-binding response regulator [Paraburkholderia sp. Se-20369]
MRMTTDIGQDPDALRDAPAAIVLDESAWPALAPRRADFDGVERDDPHGRA